MFALAYRWLIVQTPPQHAARDHQVHGRVSDEVEPRTSLFQHRVLGHVWRTHIMGWVNLALAARHAHLAKCLEDVGEDEHVRYTSGGMCITNRYNHIHVQMLHAIRKQKEGGGRHTCEVEIVVIAHRLHVEMSPDELGMSIIIAADACVGEL